MPGDPQQAVAAFLADPANWNGGVDRVEQIATHGSLVFLGGDRALKLKRAVAFAYMDFSTLERRRQFCEAEVRLNRRTAPSLYRRSVAITREADGRLALGGQGTPVEWLVEMARFDQATLFDRLAARGELTLPLIERLADRVAAFHAGADRRSDRGGLRSMREVIAGNADELQAASPALFDPAAVRSLIQAQQAWLETVAELLEQRPRQGWVRLCHGDLHLRNICLVEGQPTPFDCIEFNDEFAVIDVLYDLAFLVMDLAHRQLPLLAVAVLSRYLAHGDDLAGLRLMPLYLSVRAAVRAKVGASLAKATGGRDAIAAAEAEARQYLALAAQCLKPRPARLVAVGGLSGSGKSTLARRLAPKLGNAPGALVLRSDEIRKCLFGVAPTEPLPDAAYRPELSARVYAEIDRRAAQALAAGQAVIADAVFARGHERQAIGEVARAAGVRFDGFWLDAPQQVLAARLEARRHDASDATPEVLDQQLGYDLGQIDWRRLAAAEGADAVAAAAAAGLASG